MYIYIITESKIVNQLHFNKKINKAKATMIKNKHPLLEFRLQEWSQSAGGGLNWFGLVILLGDSFCCVPRGDQFSGLDWRGRKKNSEPETLRYR